jgi:hypothetical protein
MAAVEQEDFLHETLAGVIRNAFFDARNAGETMYKASEDAAARVLSVLLPSSMRLHTEVDTLLRRWEADRDSYPSSTDWQARIYDAVLTSCISELRTAVEHSKPMKLELEQVPETG